MLYIQPDECVECGRCEPACPNIAIFHHEDLPEDRNIWTEVNEEFFADIGSPGGARKIEPIGEDHPMVDQVRPR